MKIVSFKICPFVQRVTALLEQKQVPYDIEYIDLSNKPQWFLAASPNGQVPILITDGGDVLFESDAIVEYIDETTGSPLYSRDPIDKARERAWSYLAAKHYLAQCSAQRSPDAETLDARAAKLQAAFEKIQPLLGEAPFIGGSAMGMVDIAWSTLLHRTALIARRTGYDFLANLPRARAWRDAILQTGVPDASVSPDFEARFSAFYLADTTHLGQLALARGAPAGTVECECTVEDLGRCA
ncbi:MAG: glutathione S-transferase family protein [Pseudomonadota bacterium]